MLNIDALERRLSGAPENPNFLFCTSLNMRLILIMKAVVFLLGF
jgi:hypothetical protein